jgi:hypothetical protein
VKRKGASSSGAQRWLRAGPLLLAMACGGPQELGPAGAKCFRDDECQAGLICVAPMEGDINRVCSDDPTPLISNVDGPPVVEPMGGSAGAAGATAGGGMGAVAGAGAMAGGGMGAMAGTAGTAGNGGSGANSGAGGTDTAGTGGTDTAGTGGSAGTAGSGGTEPEGGAPG